MPLADADELPPWRGRSPGELGYLLHRAGRLVRRVDDGRRYGPFSGRPVWVLKCPVCDGTQANYIGPREDGSSAEGDVQCNGCTPSHQVAHGDAFSWELRERVLEKVSDELGFAGTEAAWRDAAEHLAQVLPAFINLAWHREGIVKASIAALERYGFQQAPTLRNVHGELGETARWIRSGKLISSPPRSVAERVLAELRRRQAQAVAINIVDFACLKLNRLSVSSVDLLEVDRAALEELASIRGFPPPKDQEDVGLSMRGLCLRPGQSGPGLVVAGKTNGTTRWKIE